MTCEGHLLMFIEKKTFVSEKGLIIFFDICFLRETLRKEDYPLLESIHHKDLVKTIIYLIFPPELNRDECKLNNSMTAVACSFQYSKKKDFRRLVL